jgi:hypothetical protein
VTSFAVTFDYRCPFARNAHESVIAGLRAGEPWEVTFRAFSLDQVHVDEGGIPVWDRPADQRGSGVLALEWGIAVRDHFPERFLDYHLASFAARHDRGLRIDDATVLAEVATSVGLDPGAVASVVAGGEPLDRLAAEHDEGVKHWQLFGVPTFITGEAATFVRFMERSRPEAITRVLGLLDWADLNEFKRTSIPR